jgi:GT2 family glycosyltransferase
MLLKEEAGFSPLFKPFYWEDVDLGFRLRRHGKGESIVVATDALVLHRHSETINAAHGRRKYHFLRLNQLRFVLRWQSFFGILNPRLWWLLRGLRECLGGDPVLRDAYFKAVRGSGEV